MQLIGKQETILQLFPGTAMGRLTNAMNEAIYRSFCDEHGKMRKDVTEWEIKDRFQACFRAAKTLRGDLHWGLERIIGALDEALRCHLAKADFKPTERKVWVPEDGR